MPWRRDLFPAPMRRVAIVAPEHHLRRVLVEVADAGVFEPDPHTDVTTGPAGATASRIAVGLGDASARLSVDPVDPDELAAAGSVDLVLGEASLEQRAAAALPSGRCRVLPGWVRSDDEASLGAAIAPFGGAIAELPGRRGLVPPTAHGGGSVGTAFRPLVSTYTTVPYRDIDPTLFAALAYVVMFGMMFGDVGHGLAIVATGLFALTSHGGRLAAARGVAPFLVGAGVAATVFGFLYGEAFGPTGIVPTLWMRPLDEPERLLVAGLVVGGVLLAVTFVMSTVNRWREDGPAVALYDPSGVGGALLLAAVALTVVGRTQLGIGLGVVGTLLIFVGLFVKAGARASGLAEALVELFDTLLRLGSNIVSFTRLAAFGLTHAVISEVVWDGTTGLWGRGGAVAMAAALALFALGNLAAFALGALVGAIQALRLEYYELFSRLFSSSGRPFTPWHVPARRLETP